MPRWLRPRAAHRIRYGQLSGSASEFGRLNGRASSLGATSHTATRNGSSARASTTEVKVGVKQCNSSRSKPRPTTLPASPTACGYLH